MKAVLEEVVGQSSDIKRDDYEFERDVVKRNADLKNSKVSSEKILRYFDNRLKAKVHGPPALSDHTRKIIPFSIYILLDLHGFDHCLIRQFYLVILALNLQDNYIGKIRLKSQSLRQQNKRLSSLLRQKEELGDVLTEIDFQQLQIENSDRIEQIEERNKDFFRLKTAGTVTIQVFNQYKVIYSNPKPQYKVKYSHPQTPTTPQTQPNPNQTPMQDKIFPPSNPKPNQTQPNPNPPNPNQTPNPQ